MCTESVTMGLLHSEGAFEWSCDCDPGKIQATGRICDNSSVIPGTYKWDYEFHNVSFDPQESIGPRGLDSWQVYPAWGHANEISGLTPPSPLWDLWVDEGPYLNAKLSEQAFGCMPGETLHFSFVVGSQYPPVEDWGGTGKWILTGLDDGEGPPGCKSWYGMLYLVIGGPVLVPGKSPMRLKELGWPTESSRQPFWVTSNFASNCDPALGDRRTEQLVHDAPLGDGHHRIDDPVAFKQGWQGGANAVLFVDPVWNDRSVSIKLAAWSKRRWSSPRLQSLCSSLARRRDPASTASPGPPRMSLISNACRRSQSPASSRSVESQRLTAPDSTSRTSAASASIGCATRPRNPSAPRPVALSRLPR